MVQIRLRDYIENIVIAGCWFLLFITWAYPKGSPRLKLPFVFCVQSQIAVWALRRMGPLNASLPATVPAYYTAFPLES